MIQRSVCSSQVGAQGGDFGAFVAPDLGRVDPEHVIGIHVNAATMGFVPFGDVPEEEQATFSPAEKERLRRMQSFLAEGNGYFQIQATRPQTLAYALTDSPAGQLAWIVEKFQEWTSSAHQLPEDAIPRDEILADVSLYWFTGTAGSAANIYYESMHGSDWPVPSGVPTGVAAFAEDIPIRRYASVPTTSCTGATSPPAAISPPSRRQTCSSRTSARSSRPCPPSYAGSGGLVDQAGWVGKVAVLAGQYRAGAAAASALAQIGA